MAPHEPKDDGLLIGAQALHQRLRSEGALGAGLRVIDLRWQPGGPTARQKFDAGHIPGAQFVDLETELSHAQPRGPGGRHPLVSPEELARVLSRLGIHPQTQVVVYDDGPGAIAARLWFMLLLHGHAGARLLDGGLKAWTQAGYALELHSGPTPAPAPLRKLARDESRLVDRARIAALVAARSAPASTPGEPAGGGASDAKRGPILLDARAPERYRGEVEPLDRAGGHIPGAINLPFARNLVSAEDPRWRSPEETKALLDSLGIFPDAASDREVIASCGSGVTACHLLAALERAGVHRARLYAGSYSDWLSEPDAEIARGEKP